MEHDQSTCRGQSDKDGEFTQPGPSDELGKFLKMSGLVSICMWCPQICNKEKHLPHMLPHDNHDKLITFKKLNYK